MPSAARLSSPCTNRAPHAGFSTWQNKMCRSCLWYLEGVETGSFPLASVSTDWDSPRWCSAGHTYKHHLPTSFPIARPQVITRPTVPQAHRGVIHTRTTTLGGERLPPSGCRLGGTSTEPQHLRGMRLLKGGCRCGVTSAEPQHLTGGCRLRRRM